MTVNLSKIHSHHEHIENYYTHEAKLTLADWMGSQIVLHRSRDSPAHAVSNLKKAFLGFF